MSEAAAGADGLLNVFVPHATSGVVIMELGAGSDQDLMTTLDRLLPRDDRWVHRHGSAGHGADHVLPLLVPPSVSVPVVGGRLALGTWQSIALLDPNPDSCRPEGGVRTVDRPPATDLCPGATRHRFVRARGQAGVDGVDSRLYSRKRSAARTAVLVRGSRTG